MKDSNEAMKEFMKNFEEGKFIRETVPNPPPYYNGDEEDNEKVLEEIDKFFNSDLGKELLNLK